MPVPLTSTAFLELVRKSNLAEPERLDACLVRLQTIAPLPSEPRRLAALLVREGLLTYFQVGQLLLGKWRGFVLGKYRVLERLGAGGMGTVYLCEHVVMRRRVAVKVLPTELARDPDNVARFQREAQAAAALAHANIVHAYDLCHEGNLHFLVMEYVDGVSLDDIVRKGGPLSVARAANYVSQAAWGLQHAHEAGLVHRDVKPSNLLVNRVGLVKVLDLGLARFFREEANTLVRAGDAECLCGTADYLAPEQVLDDAEVDIRADIYSLGATFYYLLTGTPPFGRGTAAQKILRHQLRPAPPVREARPEVPEGLAAVLETMLAKAPAQRFQTPGEVVAALEPWTREPIAPPPPQELLRLSPAVTEVVSSRSSILPPSSDRPRKQWEIRTPTVGDTDSAVRLETTLVPPAPSSPEPVESAPEPAAAPHGPPRQRTRRPQALALLALPLVLLVVVFALFALTWSLIQERAPAAVPLRTPAAKPAEHSSTAWPVPVAPT